MYVDCVFVNAAQLAKAVIYDIPYMLFLYSLDVIVCNNNVDIALGTLYYTNLSW